MLKAGRLVRLGVSPGRIDRAVPVSRTAASPWAWHPVRQQAAGNGLHAGHVQGLAAQSSRSSAASVGIDEDEEMKGMAAGDGSRSSSTAEFANSAVPSGKLAEGVRGRSRADGGGGVDSKNAVREKARSGYKAPLSAREVSSYPLCCTCNPWQGMRCHKHGKRELPPSLSVHYLKQTATQIVSHLIFYVDMCTTTDGPCSTPGCA